MTALTILFSLACDPMPDSGDPFGRVGMAESSVSEVAEMPAEEPTTGEKEEEVPKSFKEWAGEEASETEPDKVSSDSSAVTATPSTGQVKVAVAVPQEASVPPRPQTLLDAGWPLVVVKTLSDLNPPRAILGMPNGDEIVVKPGQVLEDHKLVVMAIGSQRVDIVRISQQGDRASLTSQSLPVQN